jgi:molecular chaperone GrpE
MTDEPTTSLDAAFGERPDTATDPAAEAPGAPPETDSAEELARQRDDCHERLLRMTAEFDNFRKRVERERRDLSETAGADIITDLLPILDDLERALQVPATSDEAKAYRNGFTLIHKQWLDALRKRGVTPIDTVGQAFDPRYHEAIAHETSDAHRDGEIIGEVRRGYMLRDRLLRPSMVRVAKT